MPKRVITMDRNKRSRCSEMGDHDGPKRATTRGKSGREGRRAKQGQVFYESEERLARRVGVSVSTVKRAIRLLVQLGLVVVAEQGGSGYANRYELAEVTPLLIDRAVRAARALVRATPSAQTSTPLNGMAHPEPMIGSQRTEHRVTVSYEVEVKERLERER